MHVYTAYTFVHTVITGVISTPTAPVKMLTFGNIHTYACLWHASCKASSHPSID